MVLLMRRTEILYCGQLSLNHQPFLKRTPSSKSQEVEIDFDPPEKLVYIIHLFVRLQRKADIKFERHHRRRVGYCHIPVLLLLSTDSLFSLELLCSDKHYHLWLVCACVHAQCSEKLSCIHCTVYSKTAWFIKFALMQPYPLSMISFHSCLKIPPAWLPKDWKLLLLIKNSRILELQTFECTHVSSLFVF